MTNEAGQDDASSSDIIYDDEHKPRELNRFKVWLRYLRIRIAHAVLLPELTFSQAHELRKTVYAESELTSGYVLMCALSAGIATLGLLQSSTAVVIGAMLISPLMSPIAALGFGFASIDGRRIRDAVRIVIIGAAIGIVTGMLITWLSPIRNATPEILARTQPTLLDLAVALFSGVAGGYATVIQKGGTAIGVAIATALMPPLATLGYSLGVLEFRFAMGALLLFLTNLAAIAFAFAFIARLSGAARPLYKVEWTPRYVAVLVAAFLALATPLSMTLMRITHEATMRSAARQAILAATGGASARIAQIEVSSPLFADPQVDALVITSKYANNAVADAEERLARELGEKVTINLQQVLAADLPAQTRAMVDAAMERTAAGIAADVPPLDRIRASIGLPTRSIWTNRAARMVYVEPVSASGWTLADYYQVERQATGVDKDWTVRIVPPPVPQLLVALEEAAQGEDTVSAGNAVWAVQRWGLGKVMLTAPEGDAGTALAKKLADAGITVTRPAPPDEDASPARRNAKDARAVAVIDVYAPSPAKIAAAQAKAKAEAEAKAKTEAEAKANAEAAAAQ